MAKRKKPLYRKIASAERIAAIHADPNVFTSGINYGRSLQGYKDLSITRGTYKGRSGIVMSRSEFDLSDLDRKVDFRITPPRRGDYYTVVEITLRDLT